MNLAALWLLATSTNPATPRQGAATAVVVELRVATAVVVVALWVSAAAVAFWVAAATNNHSTASGGAVCWWGRVGVLRVLEGKGSNDGVVF